jgi:hypothetical protein
MEMSMCGIVLERMDRTATGLIAAIDIPNTRSLTEQKAANTRPITNKNDLSLCPRQAVRQTTDQLRLTIVSNLEILRLRHMLRATALPWTMAIDGADMMMPAIGAEVEVEGAGGVGVRAITAEEGVVVGVVGLHHMGGLLAL